MAACGKLKCTNKHPPTHTHTCCQVLAVLLCRENLSVSQAAVSDVSDAKAEHGMREQELGNGGKSCLAFVKILPQLHHIQNLDRGSGSFAKVIKIFTEYW